MNARTWDEVGDEENERTNERTGERKGETRRENPGWMSETENEPRGDGELSANWRDPALFYCVPVSIRAETSVRLFFPSSFQLPPFPSDASFFLFLFFPSSFSFFLLLFFFPPTSVSVLLAVSGCQAPLAAASFVSRWL